MEGDFQLGPWLIQPRLNTICGAAQAKRVEPKMMQVLVYLAGHAAEVVSKEELIQAVWADTFVTDDVLLRCISELRKALEDDPKEPRYIQTIPRSGYRLVAPVQPAPPAAEAKPGRPRLRSPRRWAWAIGLAVVVLAALALFGYLARRRPVSQPVAARDKVMLAVLPFDNLSGDPEQEYFSDGLTEEMITQLGRLEPRRLGVIARTSAMQYKRTNKRIDQIGRELGVDYVLEGTVRRERERVRVTAQLIQVRDQSHVWADSYDRELSGILTVQAEVARAIARQIRLTLAGPAAAQLAGSRPVKPAAYVAYLKGNYHRHKLTAEGLEQAVKDFQSAVELDPGYAPAWLGLSDAWRMSGSWWGDLPPKQAFPLAKQAIARALELDASMGEAHGSLGWIRFVYDWDWAGAEAEFKRGIELSPNSIDAHSPYANFLRCMKRFEESRQRIERCLEIDPLSPLELGEASVLYLTLGQPERAEKLILRALEVAPGFPPAIWGLAVLYAQAGKYDQAIQALEKNAALPRPDRVSLRDLAELYLQVGREAEARKILTRLLQRPDVGQMRISGLYLLLGDKENALQWARRGFEERDPQMVWLRSASPAYPLWNDPRFQDLLRRLNFPP